MRHRRKGRKLGRSPSHQRALLRGLAINLFLTEREDEAGLHDNKPAVQGRIVTTLAKAKEARPLVERCITIAKGALPARDRADELNSGAERNTDAWRAWRRSEQWREWNAAVAPVVTARRRLLTLLGTQQQEKQEPVREDRRPRGRGNPARYDRAALRRPARRDTRGCCGWPSPDWETPARGRSSSWSASTIARRPRRPLRPSKGRRRPVNAVSRLMRVTGRFRVPLALPVLNANRRRLARSTGRASGIPPA